MIAKYSWAIRPREIPPRWVAEFPRRLGPVERGSVRRAGRARYYYGRGDCDEIFFPQKRGHSWSDRTWWYPYPTLVGEKIPAA